MHEQDAGMSREPIRLFRSDLLEFFTHVHPAVVLLVWVPVVAGFLAVSIAGAPEGRLPLHVPLAFATGLFLWTLTEYTLHRFLFHFTPHSPGQERVSFLFHGVHHAQPMVKSRLVMPPALSIPLGFFFFGLFGLVTRFGLGVPEWHYPLFAGLIAGYIVYDMLHYSTHHFRLRNPYLLYLRRNHMQHHATCPDRRFGVTSNLWDRVFGTMPHEDRPAGRTSDRGDRG